MALSEDEIKSICKDLLGSQPDTISFPGGTSREAVRVEIAGRGLIITRRKNLQRAKLEAGVLRILNQRNAPVPHLIAFKDNYLIQQDVGRNRLTQAMNANSNQTVLTLLDSALGSLHSIHQIGRDNKPLQSTVTLGNKSAWLSTFVRSAERLGMQISLPAPSLQYDKLTALLKVEQPRFIKWDARPGNAVVRENNKVIWIDWEHCGQRHPLDDAAWLLTDEYTPHLEEAETDFVAKICSAFGNGLSEEQAQEYLYVYGTLHSSIRLAMILRYHAKDGWRDYNQCLELDTVGVVRELALRVSKRAACWSKKSQLTEPLSPWFEGLLATL